MADFLALCHNNSRIYMVWVVSVRIWLAVFCHFSLLYFEWRYCEN